MCFSLSWYATTATDSISLTLPTAIAAIDMFVVATATFPLLYALIVLGHDRRRIIHFEVTQNPTQVWLSRQMTEAFPGTPRPD
jgi:putative transposase